MITFRVDLPLKVWSKVSFMPNVSRLAPPIQGIISFALTSRRGNCNYLVQLSGQKFQAE